MIRFLLLFSLFVGLAEAAGKDLRGHKSGIWSIAAAGEMQRWLIIHERPESSPANLYHLEVVGRIKGQPAWQIERLVSHMAITETALQSSVTQPMLRGAVYPESFNDAYAKWRELNAAGQAPVCVTSVVDCIEHPPAPLRVSPSVLIRPISEGVWLHTSFYNYPDGGRFPSNGLIVQEGDTLTLVDTAWGVLTTQTLLNTIQTIINKPVTRAVITHFHGDRAAGVDLLEALGVEVYAHPLTQKLTMESGMPVPDRSLAKLNKPGDLSKLGSLEVIYPGAGHSQDNIMVWLPGKRILFGGCAIRAANATSAGNTAHGDTASWLKAVILVGQRYADAALVVPGHGEPGGTELIAHTAKLLRQLDQ